MRTTMVLFIFEGVIVDWKQVKPIDTFPLVGHYEKFVVCGNALLHLADVVVVVNFKNLLLYRLLFFSVLHNIDN